MRRLRPFEYFRPTSLDEALDVVGTYHERARVLAGGTDLLVSMKHGRKRPDVVVDIKAIGSLDHLTWAEGNGFRVGATYTVEQVAKSREVGRRLAFLQSAALAIGHPQVRARATVVGNLCNGSPSADMAPSLLALDARVRIARANGSRTVPLTDFYIGPFRTVVEPNEIVTEIEVSPMPARTAGRYIWAPKVTSVDETLVGAATVVSLDGARCLSDVRIALGSMAPVPVRAWRAEELLRGQPAAPRLLREAARLGAAETSPRRRAAYRLELAAYLLERSLSDALAHAAGTGFSLGAT